MATVIHGAGPSGQRSPGLNAAIAAYLAEHGGGGDTTVQIGTVTLPESPTNGLSVSVLADSDTVLPEGVTWDSGGAPTITERMLLVFVWSGTDWVGTYGPSIPASPVSPDTTGPTAGTLTVDPGVTTADLSVSGASDETALHATPYAFSTNNGSTWSAYQAGATFEATGLTPSTSYTFRHRVRDAAGNVTVGTAVTDTTDASTDTTPPTPGTLTASAITSSGFTLTVTGASDETALHGTPYRFSTDNGATYSAWQAGATFNATGLDPETEYTCVHQVRDAALNVATGSSIAVETEAEEPSAPLTIAHTANGIPINDGTPLSWSGLAIGTATATRRVVAVLNVWGSALSAGYSDVTIGGVSADREALGLGTGSLSRLTAIYSAVVPSGTTADVVVTGGPAHWRGQVSLYVIDGAASAFLAPSDSKYNNNTTNGVALSAPTKAGSVSLFAAHCIAGGQSFTWTGATERHDYSSSSPEFTSSAATVNGTAVGTANASTISTAINISGSAATWEPVS